MAKIRAAGRPDLGAQPLRLHGRGHGRVRGRRGERVPCGCGQGHGRLGARKTPPPPAWPTGPIRWIVDDCGKFVEREIRRGRRYDAIIMDPPSYGRGPGGEVWKLEDEPLAVCGAGVRRAVGRSALCHHQFLHHGPAPVGAHLSHRRASSPGASAAASEIARSWACPVTASGLCAAVRARPAAGSAERKGRPWNRSLRTENLTLHLSRRESIPHSATSHLEIDERHRSWPSSGTTARERAHWPSSSTPSCCRPAARCMLTAWTRRTRITFCHVRATVGMVFQNPG